MPSISKSYGVWRVRIRRRGLPLVSKVFKAKADAQTWAFKTERSMELGFLSPDHDCLAKSTIGTIQKRNNSYQKRCYSRKLSYQEVMQTSNSKDSALQPYFQ